MKKVHDPTKKSKTIMSTLKLYKNYLDFLNRKNCIKPTKNEIKKHIKSQKSFLK